MVGGEHLAGRRTVQRADDAAEFLGRRGDAGERIGAGDPDPHAVGWDGAHQDVGQPFGVLQQRLVRGDGAQELV